ncbi:helix-turn-helix domain-containing protein [Halanaerobium hydrogeniformans]|uniref:Transcriptional regulator, CdaR n=1 Tax=Halanaerobium hydrogeniformans TaxID=656519 RepID=E4RPA7_HALHG|nr:helix-turn-helix domain-containing protein [Halanaerobium hydrogeniformans]ADQ13792.1 transcriptional regulator, CdaR [Halanaerobium hydrogeniformans]
MKVKEKKLIKMHSLLETIKLLNSEKNVDTILKTLMSKSLELTPGGDMGAIFLMNEKSGFLEVYASFGMGDAVKDVQLKPGESMTGQTYSKKETMFFRDSKAVQEAMNKMRNKNKRLAIEARVLAEKIQGAICCPLIYKNEVIGVLVVDNTSDEYSLKDEDVEFLNDISVQATIAIINARNYKRQLQTNKKLQKYNRIIQEQKNKYKYTNSLHTKLTNMILSGSSIKDILQELKNMIGKDIFILDIFYNLRYHSFAKDFNLSKISDNIAELIPYLRQEKTFYIKNSLDINFVIFPIIVKKEVMGWFCVVNECRNKLDELETVTAERATTIIALELIKEQEISDMEQSLKGDFLDSLLINNDCAFIKKSALSYGFNFDKSHQIIVIDFSLQSKDEQESKKLLKKYYNLINKKSKEFFPNSIALIKRNMIIIIVEELHDEAEEKIKNFNLKLKKLFSPIFAFKEDDFSYKMVISSSFKKIDDFKETYFQALNTLPMLESEKDKNYAFYDQQEIKKLLSKNEAEELAAFAEKILKPLKNYNNSSKNDLIKTLKVYLQSNCSWTTSKEKLHIHGNTLSYRLNRIKEILNIDFDDYNDRLKLQLAFEIEDII